MPAFEHVKVNNNKNNLNNIAIYVMMYLHFHIQFDLVTLSPTMYPSF